MAAVNLVEQTKLAFDFVQKLYLEVSYLVKEVEGLLAEEPEKFIIGRPGGYGVTTRSSTGLETNNVYLWPLRKLSVFFVPEEYTDLKSGQTITRFSTGLKIIHLRIILDDKGIVEPTIYCGVLFGFQKKSSEGKWPDKFEHLMGHFEYNEHKVFQEVDSISYEDAYVRFSGKLNSVGLYTLTDSQKITDLLIAPSLETFRALPDGF